MPLILERRLEADPFMALRLTPELKEAFSRAVRVFLRVPKRLLSEPYELGDGAAVSGEILEVKKWLSSPTEEEVSVFRELAGKSVEFALLTQILGTEDHLYLTRETWSLLRDYGILPEDYVLRVKLVKAEYEGKELDIYPKRSVSA